MGSPVHEREYAKGVLTDLVQIRQLKEMHRADTVAFQRHLAAHHYPEGPFRILARTVEQQIDCTACANCCRQTRVSVSEAEIAVIARYLEIEPRGGGPSIHDSRCGQL